MATQSDDKEVITLEVALSMLPPGDAVHTYRPAGPMLLGADWDRGSLIAAMTAAEEIELSGQVAASMGHKLAFRDEHGYVFVQTV